MLREEHSPIDMLMSSIKTKMDITLQLTTLYLKEVLKNSLLPTPTFLNSLSLVMNWDTLKHIQTLFACGRPSSVTLQTVLKLSLINSFPQERPNGTSRTVSSCSCPMDMMELDLSTHHPELRDSCNFAIKMKSFQKTQRPMTDKVFLKEWTWRCVSHQLQPTTSTSSEPTWGCHSGNHWSLYHQRSFLDSKALARPPKTSLTARDSSLSLKTSTQSSCQVTRWPRSSCAQARCTTT